MPRREPPTGLPLTAQPPLYQFTGGGHTIAWSNAAVFLFDHFGRPHWFATDGYSAMLTPALLPGADDGLFPLEIGPQHRVYLPDHIKSLFKYVKGKHVLYDPATGTLLSPDGIVQVPAFEHLAEEGKEPEPVPMPDVEAAFAGEPVEQSSFSLGLKFISAIRSAFSHTVKEAGIDMTCLEGDRMHLEIAMPYEARVLISMSSGAPVHEEDPQEEQGEDAQEGQEAPAKASRELRSTMKRIDRELKAEGVSMTISGAGMSATFGAPQPGPQAR